MTLLTLDNFFNFIYAWVSFWLIIFVVMTATIPGLNAADFEVMGFRGSIAFVCLSVFFFRNYDISPWWLVPAFSIFGWTAAATSIRVLVTICCERGGRCLLIPRKYCSNPIR